MGFPMTGESGSADMIMVSDSLSRDPGCTYNSFEANLAFRPHAGPRIEVVQECGDKGQAEEGKDKKTNASAPEHVGRRP